MTDTDGVFMPAPGGVSTDSDAPRAGRVAAGAARAEAGALCPIAHSTAGGVKL